MEQFELFLKERKYLKGVSPHTITSYECAFKAMKGATESKATLMARLVEMRERGLSPITINTYLRHIKAYVRWEFAEGYREKSLPIQFLKAEQKIIETLSPEQVKRIVNYKPSCVSFRRLHLLCLLLLDTGLRISEALGLTKEDVDLDNLVLRVVGKGGKHRLVPFSFEFRKSLYHFQRRGVQLQASGCRYLFHTQHNTKLTVRNVNHSFDILGKKLQITGVRFSPHTLRHTFAISYLRAGGNLFFLSRALGHSDIKVTQRYLQSVGIEDLQVSHQKYSLLNR